MSGQFRCPICGEVPPGKEYADYSRHLDTHGAQVMFRWLWKNDRVRFWAAVVAIAVVLSLLAVVALSVVASGAGAATGGMTHKDPRLPR